MRLKNLGFRKEDSSGRIIAVGYFIALDEIDIFLNSDLFRGRPSSLIAMWDWISSL